MSILTLKGTRSICYDQEMRAIGQLGRLNIEVKRRGQKNGELDLMCTRVFSNHFQVQGVLKKSRMR